MKNKIFKSLAVLGAVFALTACGSAGTYVDYLNNVKGRVVTTLLPKDESNEIDSAIYDKTFKYEYNIITYNQELEMPKYDENGKYVKLEKIQNAQKVESYKAEINKGEKWYNVLGIKPIGGFTKRTKIINSENKKESAVIEDYRIIVSALSNSKKDEYYDNVLLENPIIDPETNQEITKEQLKKEYEVFKSEEFNYTKETKTWTKTAVDDYMLYKNEDDKTDYRKLRSELEKFKIKDLTEINDLENLLKEENKEKDLTEINDLENLLKEENKEKDLTIYEKYILNYKKYFGKLNEVMEEFHEVNKINDAGGEKPIFIKFDLNFGVGGNIEYLSNDYTNNIINIDFSFKNIFKRDIALMNYATKKDSQTYKILQKIDFGSTDKECKIETPKQVIDEPVDNEQLVK